MSVVVLPTSPLPLLLPLPNELSFTFDTDAVDEEWSRDNRDLRVPEWDFPVHDDDDDAEAEELELELEFEEEEEEEEELEDMTR
mgnify:CR=1 FL=1